MTSFENPKYCITFFRFFTDSDFALHTNPTIRRGDKKGNKSQTNTKKPTPKIKHFFFKTNIVKELEIPTDVLAFGLLFLKLQEYHVAKDLSDIDFSEN